MNPHKMQLGRKVTIVAIVIVVLLGAILASDPRFIPHSTLAQRPLLIAIIFGPTILFALIAATALRKGKLWPAAGFAAGLMCTGLFHQLVAGETYGNPGYMIPSAHIAAPVVSLAAYLVCFLVSWIVVRITRWKLLKG